jgi:hypothetical protein
MDVARSRKTTKVLYLYLTIPLLIITAALGMIAMMSATAKRKPTGVVHVPADANGPPVEMGSGGMAGSGSASRPSVEIALPEEDSADEAEAREPPRESSTAGNAAIVTAIMGGLTGLMGAMTQTFMAFLKMRDRRRSRSDEASGEESSDDKEQS